MELHRTDVALLGHGRFCWQVHAAHEFAGDVRDMIVRLKYEHDRRLALPLARTVEPLVRSFCGPRTVLTWIPTTQSHRLERGYDHAELVARHLGALTGFPVRRLLRREGDVSQTGHGREERLRGPVFVARPVRHGSDIVVIDDVTTTGSTFRNAAVALAAHGTVTCVAAAWVP